MPFVDSAKFCRPTNVLFHADLYLSGDDRQVSTHHLQPQPHLHILSERRPDDPPSTNQKPGYILSDETSTNLKPGFLHHGGEGDSGHLLTLEAQHPHHHQSSQIHLYLQHEVLMPDAHFQHGFDFYLSGVGTDDMVEN